VSGERSRAPRRAEAVLREPGEQRGRPVSAPLFVRRGQIHLMQQIGDRELVLLVFVRANPFWMPT
jgi:hypothetical protein